MHHQDSVDVVWSDLKSHVHFMLLVVLCIVLWSVSTESTGHTVWDHLKPVTIKSWYLPHKVSTSKSDKLIDPLIYGQAHIWLTSQRCCMGSRLCVTPQSKSFLFRTWLCARKVFSCPHKPSPQKLRYRHQAMWFLGTYHPLLSSTIFPTTKSDPRCPQCRPAGSLLPHTTALVSSHLKQTRPKRGRRDMRNKLTAHISNKQCK